MRNVLCVLFVCNTLFSFGQSGYLGKKLSFFVGTQFTLSSKIYTPRTDSSKIMSDEVIWFTNKPTLQINYVLSKYREVTFAVEHINSRYFLDSIYIFKGNTYSAKYRVYEKSKGSIAPLGKYVSIGGVYNKSVYYIDKDRAKPISTIGVSIGAGIQRAIYKRFLINISYDAWLPLHSFYTKQKYYTAFPTTPQNYISELAKSNLVSIQIKLGYLIF